MKIAVIGTQGSGKTTIATALAEALGWRLIPETARSSPYPVNEEASPEAQRWILREQLRRERAAPADVVCDRSVLDNYAYLNRVLGRDDPLWEEVLGHLPTYGILLLTAPMRLEDDGFRSTDKAFQEEMALLIDALLVRSREALGDRHPPVRRVQEAREALEEVRRLGA